MPIAVAPSTIQSSFTQLLLGAAQHLRTVDQRTDMRPKNLAQQLMVSRVSEEVFRFRLLPTALRVLERPNKQVPELFIVLQGDIELDLSTIETPVHFFVTQVAYFRYSPGQKLLEGIFGAHYDFDADSINHPAFHAQLTECNSLLPELERHFRLQYDNYVDCTSGLLRQVRVPTAQLDYFAVLAQIAADHILRYDAAPAEIDAFARIRDTCSVVPGIAGGMGRYLSEHAANCMRSPHWYPPD